MAAHARALAITGNIKAKQNARSNYAVKRAQFQAAARAERQAARNYAMAVEALKALGFYREPRKN